MWSKSCGLAMTALALLAAPAAAQDAETRGLKTFRDWLVACDNLRNCNAFALGDEWNGAYLKVSRGGARQAGPTVTVFVDVPKGKTFSLAFDDPALEGLPKGPHKATPDDEETGRVEISEPAAVERVIASLRKAGKLKAARAGTTTSQAPYPEESEISLAGAVAALLYIDEVQGRLGTTTAMIRRGDKPAGAVPEQPAATTVTVPKAGTAPIPARPPAAVLAKGKTLCGEHNGDGEHTETNRLNGNLLLYSFACREMSGAYNHVSAVLVAPADQPQAAHVPQFRVPDGYPNARRRDMSEMLVNAGFDEATMTLSTFSKGRGIGDCGSETSWAWNGRDFVLLRHSEMPRCAGVISDQWPLLYQAVRK